MPPFLARQVRNLALVVDSSDGKDSDNCAYIWYSEYQVPGALGNRVHPGSHVEGHICMLLYRYKLVLVFDDTEPNRYYI